MPGPRLCLRHSVIGSRSQQRVRSNDGGRSTLQRSGLCCEWRREAGRWVGGSRRAEGAPPCLVFQTASCVVGPVRGSLQRVTNGWRNLEILSICSCSMWPAQERGAQPAQGCSPHPTPGSCHRAPHYFPTSFRPTTKRFASARPAAAHSIACNQTSCCDRLKQEPRSHLWSFPTLHNPEKMDNVQLVFGGKVVRESDLRPAGANGDGPVAIGKSARLVRGASAINL